MTHPQGTPQEQRDIEVRQFSSINGGSYGDHTRIHQGPVNFNISGNEAADVVRTHLYHQYGYNRGYMTSAETNKRPSDHKWLQDLYDMTARESQRSEVALAQCRIENHDQDEVLDGFVYNSVMQSWVSSRGSVLCCWLGLARRADHTHVAKCILRKVLSANTEDMNHVFLYNHDEGTAIQLPEPYLAAKAEVLKTKRDQRRAAVEEKPDTKEIVLLSFAMQAKAKGFAVPLEEIDFSGPTKLIDSLISLLVEALHAVPGHVFLIFEWPGNTESAVAVFEALDAVNGLLSRSRNRNLSHNCSVIMSVRETPNLLSLLKGHASVRADSEYQECLDSLQLRGGSLRRDEIAPPVLSSNIWIWDHPSLRKLMTSHSGALAIIGKAGCGKSVLAKTIQVGVSNHSSRFSQNRDLLVSDWFYCRRRGDVFTAYSSLLRNVLSQLLLKRKPLFHYYKLIHRRKLSTRSPDWENKELEQIIENINTSGLSILMIFDAIDEAEDDRIVWFIQTLVSRPGSSIKAILLSRPTDAFDRSFWEERKVTLQDENNQDIYLVVQHGLSKLGAIMTGQYRDAESEMKTHDHITGGVIKFKTHAALKQKPCPSVRPAPASFTSHQLGSSLDLDILGNNIRERAAGVILWVVLVFDSIFKLVKKQPVATLEHLMSCVAELPRDIDALYGQMVKDLTETMSGPALGTARQALMWINTASEFRAFTMEELWDALAASSQELNDAGSQPPTRTLIDGRIEIQSWEDFNRILRRLCGSLIEIRPPKSAKPTENAGQDSRAISGKCVVQLMHQTVKDFLTCSPAAGIFSFTEAVAQGEALRGCQNFIRCALPLDIDSIILLPKDRAQDWFFFSANMARYIEELRLFPLCLQLFNAFPEEMGVLQTQLDMKWYGLLPRWLHETRHHDLVQGWKYDPAELTLTASALGVMFQLISRRGLKDAARNLLSILEMGSTAEFWARYRGVILNALAFTVFDLESNRASRALRSKLLRPGGIRRESANLALDNRYYETTICAALMNDQERATRVPVEDAVGTIELILDYKAGKLWGLDAYENPFSPPDRFPQPQVDMGIP
ncbi:hypothetical protein KVR01_007792 [Diaporthe batatas]|uniref:uncharacterized protein n=1 Tax=Diaporthe batatas TaxID=748121 RepID=UPI001D03EAD0|nr:uncharacterized protein KVR01_007792 [Diaporthe batatas]KAG8162027.1 hypothetical protein KVR01_007792 [Diaporthe batatas]